MTDHALQLFHTIVANASCTDALLMDVLCNVIDTNKLASKVVALYTARQRPVVEDQQSSAFTSPTAADSCVIDVGTYDLYCDGACSGNPGPGGTGYVVVSATGAILSSRSDSWFGTTTNQVMELVAATRALAALPDGCHVTVNTDSQYVIGLMTQGWRVKANHKHVESLRTTAQKHRTVTFKHVRGHNGHPLQELADRKAREGVESSRRTSPLAA